MDYATFCRQHAAQLPLFLQPWWLDAVSAGRGSWRGLVLRNGDHIEGIWPLYRTTKWGLPYYTQPLLTPYCGPFWTEDVPNMDAAFARAIKQLPHALILRFAMPTAQPEAAALRSAGFRLVPYYTYRRTCEEVSLSQFGSMTKRLLNKGLRTLRVQADDTSAHLLALAQTPHSYYQHIAPTWFEQLYQACLAKGQGRIWSVWDTQNQLNAAAFFAWDNQWVYYLMPCTDKRFRGGGAARLLIWQGLQWAQSQGLGFDFEGGMPTNLDQLYASFGANRHHYWQVVRYFC